MPAKKSLSPVRLGVIGLGNMGSAHARSVLEGRVPGATLAAVCDCDPGKLEGYGDARTFTDAAALLSSGAVEAVVVAVPHPAHVSIGRKAFHAGMHVLMEKPLAVHKGEALQLLAEPHAGLFGMMFNQRTDPFFIKVRSILHSGELGEVRRFSWTITDWFRTDAYYRSSPWRASWSGEGGGVLINQGVHNIDLLQWIFGMPQRVIGRCGFGRHHPIEVEDDVTALLEYSGGTTGVFTTTSGEAPGLNRLEVACDRGLLVLEGNSLTLRQTDLPVPDFLRSSPGAYSRPGCRDVRIPLPPDRGPQHDGILRNFVLAIRDGAPLVAPGDEGIRSIELINAILLSALEDRPVPLPLDAPKYARVLKQLQSGSRKARAF